MTEPSDWTVVERVSLDHHRCRLPGWWRRRKLNLDVGSIVVCSCGQPWQLTSYAESSFWEKLNGTAAIAARKAAHNASSKAGS